MLLEDLIPEGATGMNVSVIISTYNRPRYLERVIEGFFAQDQGPYELVIADDGSGEETANLIHGLVGKAPFPVRHVWHDDDGFRLAMIRNKAVARSGGDYLIFTDDDCVPTPFFIRDHAACAEAGSFIQGHRVLLRESVSEVFTVEHIRPAMLVSMALRGDAKRVARALRMPFPLVRRTRSLRGIRGCNMSMFRTDFLAVNGFNEDFEGWGKEDSELAVRLFRNGTLRKDVKFRACCFHLYHSHFDRSGLRRNEELLERALGSEERFCRNGVDKYLGE